MSRRQPRCRPSSLWIIGPDTCTSQTIERSYMNAQVEQLEFQAEARQLLDLMVHSVYSNKDSFLRELISNASDALDKLRLEAFRNKDLDVDTSDLHIEIEVDKDARTLTIRDNGIGMTRDEVVDLIGTLAKSGTAELRQTTARGQERRGLGGADRPVRHRFLLELHGGRQGRAAHPQGRRERGHQVGIERRGHLHHRIRRRRPAGNVGHPAPQARGRRGRAARLHLGVEDQGAGQEVLRLHRLAHPDGGRATDPCRRRKVARRPSPSRPRPSTR